MAKKKSAIKAPKSSRYREGLTPSNILLDVEARQKIKELIEVMRQQTTKFGVVNVNMATVVRAAIDELHAKLMPKGKRSA